jgi:hypothetical protein
VKPLADLRSLFNAKPDEIPVLQKEPNLPGLSLLDTTQNHGGKTVTLVATNRAVTVRERFAEEAKLALARKETNRCIDGLSSHLTT